MDFVCVLKKERKKTESWQRQKEIEKGVSERKREKEELLEGKGGR